MMDLMLTLEHTFDQELREEYTPNIPLMVIDFPIIL